MTDKFNEEIAGTFYTVEDLMDPPNLHPADPAISREISKERPMRIWMGVDPLTNLLHQHLATMRACQQHATRADRRQWERLAGQVQLWLRHLEATDSAIVHVVMYPGSGSDLKDDSTAAIRA